MRWTLAFGFAVVLLAALTACGGGGSNGNGGGPVVDDTPPPTTTYGGLAYTLGQNCSFALGIIGTGGLSASSAEAAVRQRCMSEARRLAASGTPPTCAASSFEQCASIAIGENSAGYCNLRGHVRSSLSAARSAGIQNCRSELGSTADCQVLAEGCASGPPDLGLWRPSGDGPVDPPIEEPTDEDRRWFSCEDYDPDFNYLCSGTDSGAPTCKRNAKGKSICLETQRREDPSPYFHRCQPGQLCGTDRAGNLVPAAREISCTRGDVTWYLESIVHDRSPSAEEFRRGCRAVRGTLAGISEDPWSGTGDGDGPIPPRHDCNSAWKGDPGDFAQVGVQCAAACSAINAGRPDNEVAAFCGILSRWSEIYGTSRDDLCPVCRGR